MHSVSEITCPHCALTYSASEFTYVDRNGAVFGSGASSGNGNHGWRRWISAFARPFDSPTDRNARLNSRLQSLAAGLRLKCPNTECGASLPRELGDRRTIYVAVVGQSGSAKTSFLAASVVSWRDGGIMAEEGISYSPKNQSDDLDDAIKKLFIDRIPPGTTFPLAAGARHEPVLVVARSDQGAEVNIVFIDVSGEALVDEERMASETPFIAIAQHIFLLVTPAIVEVKANPTSSIARAILSDEEVADDLKHGSGNNQTSNGTLRMVEGLSEIRGALGKPIGGPNVTVSVVVTKGDLLRGLHNSDDFRTLADGVVPPVDWIDAQPLVSDVTSDDRINQLSVQIRRLLAHLHPNLARNIHHGFPEARYFIVSAAGSIAKRVPDPDTGAPTLRFPAVAPFRCTDPLLDMFRRRPELRLSQVARRH